jgi:hypothetical protein
MDSSDSISTMRLYGATIGIVSGAYSGYLSVTGASMSLGAWFMLGLGAVVLIHGIVLLTPLADRLGGASGPLMLVYSVLMLLNQLRMATGRGSTTRMDTGMGDMTGGMGGTSGGTAMMGTDAGMVAIAVLMLASGLIMTVRADMMDASE